MQFARVVSLLLFLGAFVSIAAIPAARAQTFVPVDPTTTYLHVAQDAAGNSAPIPLSSLVFHGHALQPGDVINLTETGDFLYSIYGDPAFGTGLTGVFSSSSTLLDGSLLNRVSGAIKAGPDVSTYLTLFGNEPTDIPEDFFIAPVTGTNVTIPAGAKYLFLSAYDEYFSDNANPHNNFGVTIDLVPPNPVYSGPPLYVVTDLGEIPGAMNSSGTAVNSNGVVVGITDRVGGSSLGAGTPGFIWNPSAANATSGIVRLLDLPPISGPDINDFGVVTGAVFVGLDANQNPILHAYTYDATGLLDLGTLGGQFSSAGKINNPGQVAGYSDTAFTDATGNIIGHPFLKNPGQPMVDLGTMGVEPSGRDYGYANGLNDFGQATGGATTSTRFYAFLWQPTSPNATQGTFTNLGTLPGDRNSTGNLISNYGQIAGDSYTISLNASTLHGFLWTPSSANSTTGTMVGIGTLPRDPVSEAYGVNSGGQVVGIVAESYDPYADAPFTNTKAILWNPVIPRGTSGTLTDLNSLLPAKSGWVLESANDINDAGQITGGGLVNGQAHGFLLTPIQKLAFAPSLTRASSLTARIAVTNQGLGPVKLRATSATLGSKATTTALTTVYPLAVGGSQVVHLDFPLSAGASGTRTLLKVTWQTAAGSFTSFYRVTLP